MRTTLYDALVETADLTSKLQSARRAESKKRHNEYDAMLGEKQILCSAREALQANLDAIIAKMLSELDAIHSQKDELRRMYDVLQERREDLGETNADLMSQLETARTEKEDCLTANERWVRECDSLQEQKGVLELKNSELVSDFKETRSEKEELRAKYNALVAEKRDLDLATTSLAAAFIRFLKGKGRMRTFGNKFS